MEAVTGSRLLGEVEELSLEEVSSVFKSVQVELFAVLGLAHHTSPPHYRPCLKIIMKISNTRDGTRAIIFLGSFRSKSYFQAFSAYNLDTLTTQLSNLHTHETSPSLPT